MNKALLIGLAAEDLPGVEASVAAMGQLLTERGFRDQSRLVRPTSGEIRRAFGALAEIGPDDAAVVYFAGHGHVFHVPREGGQVREHLVAPADLKASRLGDFRGILGSELTRLVRVLMARCDNVTVILDCCYAADMLRLDDDGIDDPSFLQVEAEVEARLCVALERSVSRGQRSTGPGPRAVLLLASASGGRSFPERPREEGCVLLFTRCLIAALRDPANHQRTWDELMLGLRRVLRVERSAQLPSVAGARYRKPFTTEEGRPGPDFVAADVLDRELAVEVGWVAGLQDGEIYKVYAYTWELHSRPTVVAKARVSSLGPSSARLVLVDVSADELPSVVYLRVSERGERDAPIHLGEGVAARVERASWEPSGRWRCVPADTAGALRVEEVEGDALRVLDHRGDAIAAVVGRRPSLRLALCEVLERAHAWWELDQRLDRPDLCGLGGCFDSVWRVVRPDGTAEPIEQGQVLGAKQGLCLSVEVRGAGFLPSLYARAYRVRADRQLVHFEDLKDGRAIDGTEACSLGDQSRGTLRGIALRWPEGLPEGWFTDAPAREWVILVVSTGPIPRDFLARASVRGEQPVYRSDEADYALVSFAYGLSPAE